MGTVGAEMTAMVRRGRIVVDPEQSRIAYEGQEGVRKARLMPRGT